MLKTYLFLAFTFCLFFISCSSEVQNQENDIIKSESLDKKQIRVRTIIAQVKEFNYFLQSTGKIKAYFEQKFIAESGGFIKYCDVEDNSIVDVGKLLLQLDSRAIEIKISKAKEAIFNSNINYQSDLLSEESLIKEKSQGVKDTVYRKLKASAGLTEAELELSDLLLEKSKTSYFSPFKGKLASVKVHSGQYLRPGDELFTIFSYNNLYLEAKVLETDMGLVKQGEYVNVIPISGNYKYKATISQINPEVDENGLVMVKVKLIDPEGLFPGMNATASISVPQQKSLAIPKQAVVIVDGKNVVFTLENGLSKWNYVELGLDNGKEVEIKRGITLGSKVIINNNLQLTQDTPVKEEN